MLILIGGISHSGKTLLAQKLLETHHYPYLSIDHLKMGLCRSGIACGFTPLDSTEHIAEKLWPMLKGIIMTAIENKQNLIIEGAYLLPNRIAELDDEYQNELLALYLCFSESYIKAHLDSDILRHRCAIESRKYGNSETLADYLSESKRLKVLCEAHHATYFEISEDYQKESSSIRTWIGETIAKTSDI